MIRSPDEINVMLKWLNSRIDEWEEHQSEAGWGTAMDTIQCRKGREEYAGWLAQRNFLQGLLLKVSSKNFYRNCRGEIMADIIISNRGKCLLCGDIIESKHVHDYVTCKCGKFSVDGGRDYLRRSFGKMEEWEELSEVVEDVTRK
jgi:hypothetical protein